MTDIAAPAPPGIVHSIAERTVAIFLAHWDKLLNLTLGAIVTYLGMWVAGLVNQQPAAPAPKIVEVVRTVPDTGSTAQRVLAVEIELKAFRKEFSEFAAQRSGKRKAAAQPPK